MIGRLLRGSFIYIIMNGKRAIDRKPSVTDHYICIAHGWPKLSTFENIFAYIYTSRAYNDVFRFNDGYLRHNTHTHTHKIPGAALRCKVFVGSFISRLRPFASTQHTTVKGHKRSNLTANEMFAFKITSLFFLLLLNCY